MGQALILVDLQMDYFPGGRMEVAGAGAALAKAANLLRGFREKKLPVIHIQHVSSRPGATFLLPGTEGIGIHPDVSPREGEPVLVKHLPDSFRNTGLDEKLRDMGIDRLLVAGMMTQMCVDTTVRRAFDLGYAVTLAHDACAAREVFFNGKQVSACEVQGAYMAALGAVFARVCSADEALKEAG